MKVMIALLAVVGTIVLVIGFYIVGVNNHYVDLTNKYDEQMAVIESFHDKMWKTIKSQSKVNDKKKADFQEVYTAIMEGRYSHGSKDGSLMKWIKEDNPQFDQTSYLKLMTTIEAERTKFHNEQTIMQGIVKSINDLREKFPSSMIVGSKPEAKFETISSSTSKRVMETRQDDELHLD